MEEFDKIQKPFHYNQGSIETIDLIQNSGSDKQFEGYLKGNIIKYISRYNYKEEPINDLYKAEWYLLRLIKELEDSESSVKPVRPNLLDK
tara:strand:- start:739 stop:1008 length:270 start_codon:yes stop_codon:yes gene_type:complete